jgi:hypothetical protein
MIEVCAKKEIIINLVICIYLANMATIQCTHIIFQVPNIQMHLALCPFWKIN